MRSPVFLLVLLCGCATTAPVADDEPSPTVRAAKTFRGEAARPLPPSPLPPAPTLATARPTRRYIMPPADPRESVPMRLRWCLRECALLGQAAEEGMSSCETDCFVSLEEAHATIDARFPPESRMGCGFGR